MTQLEGKEDDRKVWKYVKLFSEGIKSNEAGIQWAEVVFVNTYLVEMTRFRGSMSVSKQLRTYSTPNPTLTLTCDQLNVAGLGEG